MNAHLIWNEFGNIYSKLGHLDSAVDAFHKAIELAPEAGLPYSNLGMCYFRQGKVPEALSLYQRSLELAGSDTERAISWSRLGDIHASLGEYEKSVSAYQKAQELMDKEEQEDPDYFSDEASDSSEGLHISTTRQDQPATVDEVSDTTVQQESEEEQEIPGWLQGIEMDPEPSLPPETSSDDLGTNDFEEKLNWIHAHTQEQAPESETEGELESADALDGTIEVSTQSETGEADWVEESSSDLADAFDLREQMGDSYEARFDSDSAGKPESTEACEPPAVTDPEQLLEDNPMPSGNGEQEHAVTISEQAKEFSIWSPLMKLHQSVFNKENDESTSDEKEHDEESGAHGDFGDEVSMESMNEIIEPVEHRVVTTEPEEFFQQESREDGTPMDEGSNDSAESNSTREEVSDQNPDHQIGVYDEKSESNPELHDAIAIYERITRLAPMNDKAWDKLGNLYKDQGNYDRAKYAYEKAISISPAQAIYHYHLGLVSTAQKEYENAISTFKKIIELNPDYILAHCALAGCYRRLGLDAEAEEHIKVARPHMQSESEYNQACFEAICGNTEEAIELLAIAVDTEQTTIDWIRVDPDLDFIRDEPRFLSLVNREFEDSEVEVRFL